MEGPGSYDRGDNKSGTPIETRMLDALKMKAGKTKLLQSSLKLRAEEKVAIHVILECFQQCYNTKEIFELN